MFVKFDFDWWGPAGYAFDVTQTGIISWAGVAQWSVGRYCQEMPRRGKRPYVQWIGRQHIGDRVFSGSFVNRAVRTAVDKDTRWDSLNLFVFWETEVQPHSVCRPSPDNAPQHGRAWSLQPVFLQETRQWTDLVFKQVDRWTDVPTHTRNAQTLLHTPAPAGVDVRGAWDRV